MKLIQYSADHSSWINRSFELDFGSMFKIWINRPLELDFGSMFDEVKICMVIYNDNNNNNNEIKKKKRDLKK